MSCIPYPADHELDDRARQIIGAPPPLNVVRMFAGAPAALGPAATILGQLGFIQAALSLTD